MPLSYRLHRELAEEHGGPERWGYRRLGCGTIAASVMNADLQGHKEAAGRARAETAEPAPGMTTLDANGHGGSHGDANGAATAQPPTGLDTATVDSKFESSEAKTDGEDKEWEKLPKQDVAATSLLGGSPLPSDLDWIDPKLVQYYEEMGRRGETETSQVHPYHFTTTIAELARSAGVDIRTGAKVTGWAPSSKDDDNDDGSTKTVEYEDRVHGGAARAIRGVTDVIVTAGPWTGKLLPRSKVEGLRAHSVVYEADVSPYAVFTDIALPSDYVPEHRNKMGQKRKHRGNVDPEIYARPFGEVYACGEPQVPQSPPCHMLTVYLVNKR